MREVNWNNFRAKFNGKETKAFEYLCQQWPLFSIFTSRKLVALGVTAPVTICNR
jgi:hypothetical protein